jgi:hypothetical protein
VGRVSEVFTGYVGGAPTAGLEPEWHCVYDAITGDEQLVAVGEGVFEPDGPTIVDVGGGLYAFERPLVSSGLEEIDFCGILDLGATVDSSHRYLVARARTVEVFGAFDPAPVAGISPTWSTYKRVSDGADQSQPSITELGKGLYRFDRPASGDQVAGVIDLGAARTPRYLGFDAQNDRPEVTVVSPGEGGSLEPDGVVTVDVTAGRTLQLVELFFSEPGGAQVLVARDGAILRPFAGSRTAISTGYRYAITRDGNWPPGAVRFQAVAVDERGARIA